ncbi:hypothetical protein H6796_01850 [Candidatus Nomurabacteria bacterium]|nr:hypothetical protein [Candidatus Nomurabacteria bacterium]
MQNKQFNNSFTNRKARPRTYARNRTPKNRWRKRSLESDSAYFLKLVICVILGTLWLKFSTPVVWNGVMINALPLGLLVGLVLVKSFEKYQSDRKIWYAVLLIIGVVSYFVPAGIVV